MRSILWLITLLGAASGGFTLLDTFKSAESAPQQAAGAALAVALAVIPYCINRALDQIIGPDRVELRKLSQKLDDIQRAISAGSVDKQSH